MVLQEFFRHDLDTATQIMLKIHHEGRGVCGVFTKDVAATKVELVWPPPGEPAIPCSALWRPHDCART
jgi:hypothetical protein